jgi:hypothetical protein
MEHFRITWEVDDGYVGKSRPQQCFIEENDIEEDMTEEDLRELFSTVIQDSFEQKVNPVSDDESEFLEWAKTIQEKIKNDSSELDY